MLCLTFGFSALIASLTGDPNEALVLAYSPGGLAEMSLVALSLKIEVGSSCVSHIARVFIVIAGAAGIFGG